MYAYHLTAPKINGLCPVCSTVCVLLKRSCLSQKSCADKAGVAAETGESAAAHQRTRLATAGFEHRDRASGIGERYGARESGPAAADAPVGEYDGKPITKGTGRFGPFIKWDGLFINVPRRYDLQNLTQAEMNDLIEAKVSKEANRYIHRWEDDKISVENARWGKAVKQAGVKIE